MGMFARAAATGFVACLVLGLARETAAANPTIVVDAASGKVLEAHDATRPWYPASLSKLMTLYTVFKALKDGRVDGGMPIAISPRAARQAPSRMGYPVGTMITIDDALKMLVVHSANDIAVALAEGVSGSVDNFAAEMNANAKALGMAQSYWVNPNGLPDPRQVTSARDMALVADAIITQFPQYDQLFRIQTIRSGDSVLRTHNALVYRYPGTDGMKTGFTCAAGFNVVATATRNGRKLITVVMGAPTPKERTNQAVALFESNYDNQGGGLFTSAPLAAQLPASAYAAAPDMRDIACNRKRGGDAAAESEDTAEVLPGKAQEASAASPLLTSWTVAPPVEVGPYVGPRRPLFKLPNTPILADLPARSTTKQARAKAGAETAAGYAETSKGMAMPSQLTDPKLNKGRKNLKKLATEKTAGKKVKPAAHAKPPAKPSRHKKHHPDS
ncbi:D-alanyl-D-alanine carboxypeptidase family protein [Labrys monachus]|uniref:D-alanyl-D-alanine carboxypeptidase n=1 Tax=Labrys monachus TaxID=217067 RepID=A0ABU0FP19_9HYPH|nr:D-alanyl-D-alanine carboxypeptidase family protein [Labrys monachus]MDQ0396276.1 D-alanyl-D-alanine carboxypeptidase [Labrys monachus]